MHRVQNGIFAQLFFFLAFLGMTLMPFSMVEAISDGTEDTAFYGNLGTGFDEGINTLAVQNDGDILIGGEFTDFNGNTRNRLVRLNADGTEDMAFYTNLGTGFDENIRAFAVQSDGDILVGGEFEDFNSDTRNYLVRLNADGTEDMAFYTNLGSGFDDGISAIAVQSDGDILVGGSFTDLDGNTRNRLVRLNADGTEDMAFYTNLGSGFDDGISAIAVQSDGDILVGGFFTDFNGNTRNRLVRLNADGTEDTTFYTNLGTGFGAGILALAVQSDGGILVGGEFTDFNGNTRNRLVRLNANGTEDTTFYTNLGAGFDESTGALAVQSDGDILVGGSFENFSSSTRNYLVRLNSDGSEDTAFYTNLGTGFDENISVLTLQSDGDILVGGFFEDLNGNTRNYLVRLTLVPPTPLLDTATTNTAGDGLVLTYDIALDGASIPVTGDFMVDIAGNIVSVTGVSIANSTVTLTLASAATNGQAVRVSYTPGAAPIQGTLGGDAAALVAQFVTNAVPALSSRRGGGSVIYGCKDPQAANYTHFAQHNQALCQYEQEVSVPDEEVLRALYLEIITLLNALIDSYSN